MSGLSALSTPKTQSLWQLAERQVEALGCVPRGRNWRTLQRSTFWAVGPKDQEDRIGQETNVKILEDLVDLRVHCLVQVEGSRPQPCRQCPHRPTAFRSPLCQGDSEGCGRGRCVSKISILRHGVVKREDVDSARTHCERQVPCCTQSPTSLGPLRTES